MKFHLKSALVFILIFQWFQHISGFSITSRNALSCSDERSVLEEHPDDSAPERWTCSCASGLLGMQSSVVSENCSTACSCRPEEVLEGPTKERWTCVCDFEGVTETLRRIHDTNCFTSCNCTSGSFGVSKVSRKRISSKVVVYILLVCVIFTTVALLASVTFYICRKDRFPVQPPIFSTHKDTSFNSFTDLISHRSASVPEVQFNISSCFNPVTGCIYRASFLFRNKQETIPGHIIKFSYSELEQATNGFSSANLIGLGGSSSVYRGQLKHGRAIAVKRLKAWGGMDAELGFLSEIELISRLHHCHIVPLLGFCCEAQGRHVERLQVFEYMPNGNLRDCLDATQGKEPINWVTRVSIALGAARGLEYLHEAAAPKILHRDVKSSNILLDDKWRAKITDLGMAKQLATEEVNSCPSSPARMLGTFGYFAPEYAIIGKASPKSDVFSFGVVLLELISGRRPINNSSKKEESLVMWATPLLYNRKRVVTEIADPLLKGNFPEEDILVLAQLAGHCLNLDPESRPTMTEVVQILSTITPDKSERRNFAINFFQLLGSSRRKSSLDLENVEEKELQVICDGPNDSVNRQQSRPLSRVSLPLEIDRDLCAGYRKEDQPDIPANYIERLILLTSKARSWRAQDDESVDLTEPRFEKFWQANVRSL